jgi:hypothetical protein
MKPISRRDFGALVAAGVISGRFDPTSAFAQTGNSAVTAATIIERIRRNIGVDWAAETVDTVKAGDPDTVVTGIVTTAMATMDVLREAVDAGANLIITAQPTFYSRGDPRAPVVRPPPGTAPDAPPPPPPPPDAVYTVKNRFIDENSLVVFRLSDHWRRREPNGFAQGLARTLSGNATHVVDGTTYYETPPVTLRAFASDVKRRLGSRGGIRVIGDPGIQVRRVGLLPGTTAITAALEALPAADVVIAGEVREWESVEYARDVVYTGRPKALVLVGRVVSDEPGMALCADWIRTLATEVPVRHIAAGDPYWRPQS